MRLAFRFEPNEQLTITPRVIYQEVDIDGWNRVDLFNILGNPYTTTRPAVDLGEREQFTQFDEPFTDEFLLADLNIDYDFGDGGADLDHLVHRSRHPGGARRRRRSPPSITGGSIGLPESVYTLDAPLDDATTAKVLTQELRLAGGNDTLRLAGRRLLQRHRARLRPEPVRRRLRSADRHSDRRDSAAPTDVLFFSDLSYDFDQFALFGEVDLGGHRPAST